MTRPKKSGARILVATDLSPPADEAIRQAHDWSTRLGAELVRHTRGPTRPGMGGRRRPSRPSQERECDLIIVGTRGRQMTLGSVAEQVVRTAGREGDGYRRHEIGGVRTRSPSLSC